MQIDRAGQTIAGREIASGALDVITLPWIEGFDVNLIYGLQGLTSAAIPNGAYHLTSNLPVVVNGLGPLQVSQFLVGQSYSRDNLEPNFDGYGDPSMSLIAPSDQFRSDYTILAPESYALHYINLVYRNGVNVTLDGMVLPSGQAITDSPWVQQTVEVSGGVHQLLGSGPFGVWVYGFGNYTSYMYPGGLDLKVINDVE